MAYQLASPGGPQPSNYNNVSSSPEPGQPISGSAASTKHRRNYQACQGCRDRKVKCDLGSVDAPRDPPCKRCKRERLVCEFAKTRKKQKTSHDAPTVAQPFATYSPTPPTTSLPPTNSSSPAGPTNGYARNGGTSMNGRPSFTSVPRSYSDNSAQAPMYKPPSHQGNLSNTSNIGQRGREGREGREVHLPNPVAAATFGAQVSSTHDNMKMLITAASAFSENNAAEDQDSPLSDRGGRKRTMSTLGPGGPQPPLEIGSSPEEKADKQAGMQAWSKSRFVRNGWFTSWEAMQMVEYFYQKLAPMTPVTFNDYRSPVKHYELLTDEPILALAILAIASRYMPLSGHAATSRSYQIHDKLWNSLRRQVERLLWGQEQFGGGYCGAGESANVRESSNGQITWKGSLRTLGTIEALLVLTDWQPRALHFPPHDEESGLLDLNLLATSEGADDGPVGDRDFTNIPYAAWLEPSWRSDRMSWMLLSLAQSLAFELGVFDMRHATCRNRHDPGSECARKRRIRRLLLVYTAQTSGRMGVQSSLEIAEKEHDPLFDVDYLKTYRGRPEVDVDVMHDQWFEIAKIMSEANKLIFASHEYTKELVNTGEYKKYIDEFAPLLQTWKNKFEKARGSITPIMQSILLMEYEYARLYINSLGFQKMITMLVESGSSLRKDGLAKIAEENMCYVDEVTKAATNILSTIVDSISAKGYLRDMPVRTYLRALSGMMFTLKRFSVGISEPLARKCLHLLDKVTIAMAEKVVDDVHLSSSTSRLVQGIIKNLKDKVIRVQQPGTGSAGPSRDQSRPQSPNGEQGASHQGPPHQLSLDPAFQSTDFSPDYWMNDPLAEIAAKPMAELESQAFIPPPNFHLNGPDVDTTITNDPNIDPAINNFGSNQDWFVLPLDNLWQDSRLSVDHGFGGMGPTVGRQDLLEVIAMPEGYQATGFDNNQYSNFNGMQ